MTDKLKSRLSRWRDGQDTNVLALLRGASRVGVLKALSAVFGFALSVVLGRVLGAESTGIYFLAFTTATIAATVGRIGLDSTVIRYVAHHTAQEKWSDVRSVQRAAMFLGAVCSIFIATVLYLAANFLAANVFSDEALARPLQLMAIAVVPLSLSVLYSRALQGLSQIRDSVLVFSIFPTGLALFGTWLLARTWGVNGAIAAYVFAVTVAAIYGWIAWHRAFARRSDSLHDSAVQPPYTVLLSSGAPLLIGALLQLAIQMSGTLMLGIWADHSEVSQFSVAWRTALLLTFALLAVNTVAQPRFAELYSRGDRAAMAATANKAALIMTVCAAPLFLVFLLAPRLVMSAFGSDFVDGAAALQILSIGQFVNVAAGSVGVLLVMSGHERDYRNVQVVAAFTALILNWVLIPSRGATGAAIAVAAALAVQNVLFAIYVWKRLQILTIVPRRFVTGVKKNKEPKRRD